jgi:hypothetical protein
MKKSVEKSVTVIPDEFKKVIFDFVGDISNTFPEYRETLGSFLEGSTNDSVNVVSILYEYCSKVYPERFFDILYKNDKIFNKEDEANANVNTHFLPNIDFCALWNTEGISDASRETIWKYLQLILMTIITNIEDKKSFGDAANLFEAINENELRGKLEETIQQMYNMFEPNNASSADAGADASASADNATNNESNTGKKPSFNFFDWAKDLGGDEGDEGEKGSGFSSANAESIHEHISNILNGKIGKLAKEIAEETAKDVDFDMDFDESKGDGVNFQNVFQKMFKNPGKLMGLVKSVGSKLDQKFKSGEIKESELMQEASDLLSKMKNMPGMNNLTDMLNKMGMGNMGGNMKGNAGGKMNFGAMQSQLQKNMKMSKMKERMQEKLAQKQQQQQAQQQPQQQSQQQKTHPAPAVFSTGETVERTPVDASIPSLTQNQNKKKHKKNKSKK